VCEGAVNGVWSNSARWRSQKTRRCAEPQYNRLFSRPLPCRGRGLWTNSECALLSGVGDGCSVRERGTGTTHVTGATDRFARVARRNLLTWIAGLSTGRVDRLHFLAIAGGRPRRAEPTPTAGWSVATTTDRQGWKKYGNDSKHQTLFHDRSPSYKRGDGGGWVRVVGKGGCNAHPCPGTLHHAWKKANECSLFSCFHSMPTIYNRDEPHSSHRWFILTFSFWNLLAAK